MDHQDITVALLTQSGFDTLDLEASVLDSTNAVVTNLVDVRVEQDPNAASIGDGNRKGLGFVQFKEQRFYSIKLGNLRRQPLSAISAGGGVITGAFAMKTLVSSAEFAGWLGASALIGLAMTLVGHTTPVIIKLSLDEAITLDLAWSLAEVSNGFRLISLEALKEHVDLARERYQHAGFNCRKLESAMKKLERIGMLKEAGPERYQLIEELVFSDAAQLNLGPSA